MLGESQCYVHEFYILQKTSYICLSKIVFVLADVWCVPGLMEALCGWCKGKNDLFCTLQNLRRKKQTTNHWLADECTEIILEFLKSEIKCSIGFWKVIVLFNSFHRINVHFSKVGRGLLAAFENWYEIQKLLEYPA